MSTYTDHLRAGHHRFTRCLADAAHAEGFFWYSFIHIRRLLNPPLEPRPTPDDDRASRASLSRQILMKPFPNAGPESAFSLGGGFAQPACRWGHTSLVDGHRR
jgi:hypothetical protein